MDSNQKKLLISNEKILFISYFLGVKGNCPAEWADDKLRVLQSLDQRVVIITSLQSKIKNNKNCIVYKLPSLSYSNFKYELKIYKKNNNGKFPIILRLFYVVSLILGSLYDFLMMQFVKSLTGGYWSWFLISLPFGIYIKIKYKLKKIFSTGGPSSSHLLASTLAAIFNIKCICEHQDPIIGAFIKNPRSKKLAYVLDAFFTKFSSKIIFVTKEAANISKKNSIKNSHKIENIYPGSWNFSSIKRNSDNTKNKIELLHLGTLYNSRNLDNLFIALDKLYQNNKFDRKVSVINCGDIYLDNKSTYTKRDDFKLIKCKSRIEGLKQASKSNYLLLVQHKDERSKETIPYKFYDYLNLKIPILAITNNEELDSLVLKAGGIVAKANSVKSIYSALKKILNNKHNYNYEQNDYLVFDIKTQLIKALN